MFGGGLLKELVCEQGGFRFRACEPETTCCGKCEVSRNVVFIVLHQIKRNHVSGERKEISQKSVHKTL